MTPDTFIAKWRASELKERSAAQEHFIDLCRMLGEPTPAEADPTGDRYCFERGARKDTGGDGWADVWKRGCFAWEYKGRRANLDTAFDQLRQYALALENPLVAETGRGPNARPRPAIHRIQTRFTDLNESPGSLLSRLAFAALAALGTALPVSAQQGSLRISSSVEHVSAAVARRQVRPQATTAGRST